MTTFLYTKQTTDAGIECNLKIDGKEVLMATIKYIASGLYRVHPSDIARCIGKDLISTRCCLGLEAAEFYALCITSEYKYWKSKEILESMIT